MFISALNYKPLSFCRGTNCSNPAKVTSQNTSFPSPLKCDTLELSCNQHKVKVKDITGNEKEAVITESASSNCLPYDDSKKFIISVDGKMQGFALVKNNKDKKELNLFRLYTEEHEKRNYKGLGTELLKCVVQESIKRGYNGKIRLFASHLEYSPLAFYYKNNFIIPKPTCSLFDLNQNFNAAIQYAIENNIPVNNILPDGYDKSYMYLDEKGAKAFLEGTRLYEKRFFEKRGTKEIGGHECSAAFVQSPYENEYFILITDENAEQDKAKFLATLEIKENEAGKKYFEITDLFDFEQKNKEHKNFALEEIKSISKENGFDNAVISRNLSEEARLVLNQ